MPSPYSISTWLTSVEIGLYVVAIVFEIIFSHWHEIYIPITIARGVIIPFLILEIFGNNGRYFGLILFSCFFRGCKLILAMYLLILLYVNGEMLFNDFFLFFLRGQMIAEVIYGLSKLMIQIYLTVYVKIEDKPQPVAQQIPLYPQPYPQQQQPLNPIVNPQVVVNIQQQPQQPQYYGSPSIPAAPNVQALQPSAPPPYYEGPK